MSTSLNQIELNFEPLNLAIAHPFGISYSSASISENVLVKLSFEGLVGLGEILPG